MTMLLNNLHFVKSAWKMENSLHRSAFFHKREATFGSKSGDLLKRNHFFFQSWKCISFNQHQFAQWMLSPLSLGFIFCFFPDYAYKCCSRHYFWKSQSWLQLLAQGHSQWSPSLGRGRMCKTKNRSPTASDLLGCSQQREKLVFLPWHWSLCCSPSPTKGPVLPHSGASPSKSTLTVYDRRRDIHNKMGSGNCDFCTTGNSLNLRSGGFVCLL